jgi:hypothetical protein
LEERLNKDPKWLKYGAFEKCPRWRLQGWKWSPRVRPGLFWAWKYPQVSQPQCSKQIEVKTNILSSLLVIVKTVCTCVGGLLPWSLYLLFSLLPSQSLSAGLWTPSTYMLSPTRPWVNLTVKNMFKGCELSKAEVHLFCFCLASAQCLAPRVLCCYARRGAWHSLFSYSWLISEYLRRLQEAIFLNATGLVHNWASASVSLLSIPVTSWDLRSACKLQQSGLWVHAELETVSDSVGKGRQRKCNQLSVCDNLIGYLSLVLWKCENHLVSLLQGKRSLKNMTLK